MTAELDRALTAQILVAWAGEREEESKGRLRWWASELVSEFGGEDLFQRLLPQTWDWAVLQGAREAARRHDAALRARDHEPDRLVSLFSLGFELDEQLDERLMHLKRSGKAPPEALPGLVEMIGGNWDKEKFAAWVVGHGKAQASSVPAGRRLKGAPPESLEKLVGKLVAGLAPLPEEYPLPHFVRSV